MSSDSGSGANGTTNLIEDWGPDPWGFDWSGSFDPGSSEDWTVEPTLVEQMAERGEILPVLLGVVFPDGSA